jgi:hypothetical protein
MGVASPLVLRYLKQSGCNGLLCYRERLSL